MTNHLIFYSIGGFNMDILKISNLSKIISNKLILDDISFSVHEGEIFGFLGPNGAGKTTTIKIITGLMKPSSGEILINNTNIEKEPLKAISNIGAIVENPSLYKYLTGLENLKLVAKLRHVNINERDYVIDEIIPAEALNEKVSKYSLGMKERLSIGCALIGNPKILILDEPTNGLDPEGIIHLRKILKKLVQEKNMTIFISSHQLNEIQNICSRIAFIKKGKIQSVECMDEILKSGMNLEDKYMSIMGGELL